MRVLLDPGPRETFAIHVRRADGQDASGMLLMMSVRTNGCEANSGVLVHANAHGDISASFTPAELESLWLQSSDGFGGSVSRYLSEAELQALFKMHELTVTW